MVSMLKRHRLFLSLLLLSVVIFMGDLLILKSAFIYGDYKLQFFPWSKVYSDSIKQFSFPFWVANMGCGFPLVAEGQIGAFYPLNIIFFFLLPFFAAYNYSIIFHFVLGGIFMYMFMRCLGLKRHAAAIPAILFMFSSPYAGCFSNIASLKTLCWLPLCFYLIFLSLVKNKHYCLLLAGVVMGIQLLAGALQMAVYSIFFSCVYFFILLIDCKGGWAIKIKLLCLWLLAISLAAAISSPQIASTYRLVQFSNRPEFNIDFASWSSFFPAGIITLFFPSLATIFRSMIYIGILPLFFAVASLYEIKKRHVFYFWLLFVLSLVLSFGSYTPFYGWILNIFSLYSFRTPTKILFFSAFFMIVLSGYGLAWLVESKGVRLLKRFLASAAVLSFAAITAVICGYLLLLHNKGTLLRLGREYVENNIYNRPFHRYPLDVYISKLESFYQTSLSALTISNPFIYVPLVIISVSIFVLYAFVRKKIRQSNFLLISTAVIFLDLMFFSLVGSGFRGNVLPVKDGFGITEAIRHIKRDGSLSRVYLFNSAGDLSNSLLWPNANIYFGIDNVGIYSPLVFRNYRLLLEELGCVDDSLGVMPASLDALKKARELINMMNVKYIISDSQVQLPGLELIKEDNNEFLYLNTQVLPRAYIANQVKVIPNENKAAAYMKSAKFSSQEAVLCKEPKGFNDGFSGASGELEIKKYTDSEVLIGARMDSDGILVLSDYYYPGWQVFVDGKETEILQANLIMRGIQLSAGRHQVRFIYKRPLF